MKILIATAALLLCLSASSEALKAGERYLGDLTTYDHGVRGSVYAVDGDTLRVEGFHYDGRGPDAFFYVGRDGGEPGPQGELVPYPRSFGRMRPRRLAQSSGQSVLLTLPQGWSTDELTWISVWCRRFGVNFGDLIIPEEEEEEIGGVDLDEILGADGDDDFEDEDEAVEGEDQDLVFLGDLTSYEHDVQGSVFMVDDGTLLVKGFHYDGAGPDAFFYVGTEGRPEDGGTLIRFPTWEKEQKLGEFLWEDVRLVLPPGLSVSDLKWISVWCRMFKVNFGDLILEEKVGGGDDEDDFGDEDGDYFGEGEDDFDEEDEDVDRIDKIDEEAEDEGNYLGDFSSIHHGLKGSLYYADEQTLLLKGFEYDGGRRCSNDVHVLAGDMGDSPVMLSGITVPFSADEPRVLGVYDGSQDDITLRLPAGTLASSLRWVTVRCNMYNVDYGWVTLDQGVLQSKREVSSPEPKEEEEDNRRYLGDFRTIHHGVRGSLYYVDEYTLALRNFEYDGWGVCADDVFVVVGDRGDIPWRQRGLIVPFSRRDPRVLGAYDGGEGDIILRLPAQCPASMVRWLSIRCRRYGVDFGWVTLDQDALHKREVEQEPQEEDPFDPFAGVRPEIDLKQDEPGFDLKQGAVGPSAAGAPPLPLAGIRRPPPPPPESAEVAPVGVRPPPPKPMRRSTRWWPWG